MNDNDIAVSDFLAASGGVAAMENWFSAFTLGKQIGSTRFGSAYGYPAAPPEDGSAPAPTADDVFTHDPRPHGRKLSPEKVTMGVFVINAEMQERRRAAAAANQGGAAAAKQQGDANVAEPRIVNVLSDIAFGYR